MARDPEDADTIRSAGGDHGLGRALHYPAGQYRAADYCGEGTKVLAGNRPEAILAAYRNNLNGNNRVCSIPPLWDGTMGERIREILFNAKK
jgi:hypothetical protein